MALSLLNRGHDFLIWSHQIQPHCSQLGLRNPARLLLPGKNKTTPLFAVWLRESRSSPVALQDEDNPIVPSQPRDSQSLTDALQVVKQPRCSQSGTGGLAVSRCPASPKNPLKLVLNTSKGGFFLLHLVNCFSL